MSENERDDLTKEVLKPILYTDIFDYPLTLEEVYKFSEVKTTPGTVKALLDQAVKSGRLILVDGFYSLAHRPQLAAKRRERQQISAALWPKASYYGRWLAALPFVRMVAVTGSLAVENPRNGVDDIDYLIVTQPGRLWLCRAMIILMVRYGHRRGVHLCPNYLITENVLDFEHDFFIAREMLQMKPLYGQTLYLKMREINSWVTAYFPQGNGLNLEKLEDELSPGQANFKQWGELILGGGPGSLLEKWLQWFQVTKHTRRAERYGVLDKVIFTADVCKGHYDGHGQKTMGAYQKRIEEYELSLESGQR
jgi:hypothetical protein